MNYLAEYLNKLAIPRPEIPPSLSFDLNFDPLSPSPERSASPEPEAYQNRKLSLTAFVQLLDEKRDQLMGELPPNVALDQLDATALREYIDLVLSAVDGFEHGRVLHDVDSALILSATFPWREQYDILTTYEEKRALHGNLHAQVRFEDEDTSQAEYRDPGSDSNVFWATCGDGGRHRIHIMLPKAGDTEMVEIHEAIYNATREACVYWNEASANSWSPTYETELNRTARFTNSRFRIESKKVVGEAFGSLVAEQVIESIRRKGWGKDAYWFIQMRGCKDFTRHDGSRTREVIDHLLEPVERASSAIFVDVAVELQLQNGWACMPWRPDYAPETLAEVALGFEEGDWSWKKYQPDIWAGVAAIAGFRCNFANEPRTENLISYMQVYTTDKFQTYNPSGTSHKSLYLTGPQALHMKGPDEIPVPIHKVYNATVANQIENTPTATRIEARVPVQHASRVFSPTLQVQDLSDVLHVVPSYVIWAWRLHRLGACQLLLRLAASVRQDSRADTQYLTLVAALIYLLNSIHSRPGELHFDRKLAAAIFPTCSLEVNEWTVLELGFHNPRSRSTLVPFMEYGGIFLPSIVYPSELEGDVLRFQFLSRGLDRESAANALGMKLADIDALFVPEYLVDAFAGGHLKRKRTKPSDPLIRRPIPLPPHVRDFSYEAPRSYFDHGHDLPASARIGSPPPENSRSTASEHLLELLIQIIQRVGSLGQSRVPYCNISDDNIRKMSLDTFRDMNLSTYFMSYQYTRDEESWIGIVELLFPAQDQNPVQIADTKVQGWRGVPAYKTYLEMRKKGGAEFNQLRKLCLETFHTLKWFPRVTRDRLLSYTHRTTWTTVFPYDASWEATRFGFGGCYPARLTPSQITHPTHEDTLPPVVRAVFGGPGRSQQGQSSRSASGTSNNLELAAAWARNRSGRTFQGRRVVRFRDVVETQDEEGEVEILLILDDDDE
ncbi:hypothetical protein AAF712_008562 [Marasmius tenuissimus]|uniref:Uncharacterized protein n=1 Tax=Marasmius tenuissimus TaxID=585030 RepID=A0ABR2ZTM4_9AGAR